MATVIYDLECEFAHRFEGWFRSLEDFDSQRHSTLLQCPKCGSSAIRKVPSKLNIGQSRAKQTEAKAPIHSVDQTAVPQKSSADASPSPSVAAAFLLAKQAVQAMIANSEDVGGDFADEARKIHYEQAPARAIRGQASLEEFEELKDEGIEVFALPQLPRDDELN